MIQMKMQEYFWQAGSAGGDNLFAGKCRIGRRGKRKLLTAILKTQKPSHDVSVFVPAEGIQAALWTN